MSAFDAWGPVSPGLSDPAYAATPITPNDGTDLVKLPKALYVGTGGHVMVLGMDDDDAETLLFKNVPSGTVLPFRARRVKATGTTAADIVALY